MQSSKNAIIALLRLGLGQTSQIETGIDWQEVETLAIQQGLLGVVVDGIEKLSEKQRPRKNHLLQLIGLVMRDEARYTTQQKTAAEIAGHFHDNYIRTYILKGFVISECYPRPEHRVSSDIDCLLLPVKSDFDAWQLGNDIIKASGYEVSDGFYKNSTFYLPGALVENHLYMIPFRGNKKLKRLEIVLQGILRQDKGEDRFDETWLYRPPVMVTALFLIEHAYSHFLHEGLTWRHVLDWMMYSRRHKTEIDWDTIDELVDEFGFRKFYDSFRNIGFYLLGEVSENDLTKNDKRMLDDIWAPLDLHDTLVGIKGKLGLVGNTLRAWWKYHYYGNISMVKALLIQTYGVLFDKNPSLE